VDVLHLLEGKNEDNNVRLLRNPKLAIGVNELRQYKEVGVSKELLLELREDVELQSQAEVRRKAEEEEKFVRALVLAAAQAKKEAEEEAARKKTEEEALLAEKLKAEEEA
jgi:hypothetical protein